MSELSHWPLVALNFTSPLSPDFAASTFSWHHRTWRNFIHLGILLVFFPIKPLIVVLLSTISNVCSVAQFWCLAAYKLFQDWVIGWWRWHPPVASAVLSTASKRWQREEPGPGLHVGGHSLPCLASVWLTTIINLMSMSYMLKCEKNRFLGSEEIVWLVFALWSSLTGFLLMGGFSPFS